MYMFTAVFSIWATMKSKENWYKTIQHNISYDQPNFVSHHVPIFEHTITTTIRLVN